MDFNMETCHQTGCSNPPLYYSYMRQWRLCRECFRAMVREGVIRAMDFKLMQ